MENKHPSVIVKVEKALYKVWCGLVDSITEQGSAKCIDQYFRTKHTIGLDSEQRPNRQKLGSYFTLGQEKEMQCWSLLAAINAMHNYMHSGKLF